jgi:hypothetical protein
MVVTPQKFNADENQTSDKANFYRVRGIGHPVNEMSNRLIIMKEKSLISRGDGTGVLQAT